jgi:hypothetical protein
MAKGIDPQLLYEIKDQKAQRQGLTSYECPCKCCHGARQQICITIRKHLHQHDRNPFFQWPMVYFFSPLVILTYMLKFATKKFNS